MMIAYEIYIPVNEAVESLPRREQQMCGKFLKANKVMGKNEIKRSVAGLMGHDQAEKTLDSLIKKEIVIIIGSGENRKYQLRKEVKVVKSRNPTITVIGNGQILDPSIEWFDLKELPLLKMRLEGIPSW